MADGQRNQPCRCGSGRKAKRCCGVRRGPSDEDLARAWLDVEARSHARTLLRLDEDEVDDVYAEMADLPSRDMSLQISLPRLLPPELELLRVAIADQDVDEVVAALPAALSHVDSPRTRQALARAVLASRDAGRVDAAVAAAAIVELATTPASRLLRNSLVEALAVSVGATETPSGLLVAAR